MRTGYILVKKEELRQYAFPKFINRFLSENDVYHCYSDSVIDRFFC